MSNLIIYHGGFSAVKEPEIRISANNKDFGQGFYCTKMRQQSERWAKRFATPVVSVFNYSPAQNLEVLSFDEMSDEWLDFIAACRSGTRHNYDIIVGSMANDQVWNYVADYISGILTREQFWVLAKFKHPTYQIAFCTPKALETLQYIENYEVR